MRLATVAESQEIDLRSQNEFHLQGDVLMEAAGALSAREIQQAFIPELRYQRGPLERPLLIVCGPGNNGADGLVVARHLRAGGERAIQILLLGAAEKRSPLFQIQLQRCQALAAAETDPKEFRILYGTQDEADFNHARLIVDAIFGIGFRGSPEDVYRTSIQAMNTSRRPLVSLDVPSGLDADRGVCPGVAIQARLTISFGSAKPGFFVSEGPHHVGRLRILPIGFPLSLQRQVADSRFAFTESMAQRALPRRSSSSHKTDHGHALILAGHDGMWGAAILSASSAARVGAGYVTLAATQDLQSMITQLPEVLTARSDQESMWQAKRWTAVGIGPGLGHDLGRGDETYAYLKRLLDSGETRVVVDADALTVMSERGIREVPSDWILTPHAGELARLLKGPDAKEIESDRFRWASEAAGIFGCHVLLKGYRTVVAKKNQAWVILSGNSSLAKAGTGDVLTGMITGLRAQGLAPLAAACAGAYIHGRIADEWLRAGQGRASLTASDVREVLPGLMARLAPRDVR